MAFLGHFDKMCMKHGPDAMRAEFERILPSMKCGKVIASVDHQTPPDVSIENYKAYVSLLHEYAARVTHEQGGISPCPVFNRAERSNT
jgi:uroporphyrinogen-III decarboxylase